LNDTYSQSKGVLNIFVWADSLHDYPVAIVVPNAAQITSWKNAGISDFKKSKQADDDILANLLECHGTYKLTGFERIRKVLLDDVEFTIDNGLLTPSMKPNGSSLSKKFSAEISALYRE
jgi:long-chain acyl-CoA synthetase